MIPGFPLKILNKQKKSYTFSTAGRKLLQLIGYIVQLIVQLIEYIHHRFS